MKKSKVIGCILCYCITLLTIVSAQVDSLQASQNIYWDEVNYVIKNPTQSEIEFYYTIIIQDNILGRTDGYEIVGAQDSVLIQVKVDSAQNYQYTITLSDDVQLRNVNRDTINPIKYSPSKNRKKSEFSLEYFDQNLQVNLPNRDAKRSRIILYTMNGQVAFQYDNITRDQLLIRKGDLPAGIYVLCFENEVSRECKTVFLQ